MKILFELLSFVTAVLASGQALQDISRSVLDTLSWNCSFDLFRKVRKVDLTTMEHSVCVSCTHLRVAHPATAAPKAHSPWQLGSRC